MIVTYQDFKDLSSQNRILGHIEKSYKDKGK